MSDKLSDDRSGASLDDLRKENARLVTALLDTDARLHEYLGVCIHTALRKGVDNEEANLAWHAIKGMADSDWRMCCDYIRAGLMSKETLELIKAYRKD